MSVSEQVADSTVVESIIQQEDHVSPVEQAPETVLDAVSSESAEVIPSHQKDHHFEQPELTVKSRKASQENAALEAENPDQVILNNPHSPNHSDGTETSETGPKSFQEEVVAQPAEPVETLEQQQEAQQQEQVVLKEEPPIVQQVVAPAEDAQIDPQSSSQNEAASSNADVFTMEKRMALANELKEQAKEPIKAKNYSQALALYEQALDLTNPQFFRYANEDMRKEFTTLSVNLLNNLAFCYYHLNQFLTSAKISEQSLIIDKNNLKAMYRRAVCYKNLNDLERAFEIIKHAVKNGGNTSKEIYQEYETIKELYKEYIQKNKQREKEVYSRMVDSSAVKKAKEEEIQKEKQLQAEAAELEANQKFALNSLYLFGSSAFSFLVASKVFRIDVTTKTGFSLAGSLTAALGLTSILPNIIAKSLFGLTSFILFGYMYHRRAISN